MKIIPIGEPRIVMENPQSRHHYFAWPTVTRLQSGVIAVVASGFRLRHICPFGKTVIVYSNDEGARYTAPAPVIDTVLDDRDGGIATFGKKGVIVTSFNNTVEFQRRHAKSAYDLEYLNQISPEEEKEFLGNTFRISHDGGITFGKLLKSPVTSPHGPTELPDGTLLWVGRAVDTENGIDAIQAHKILPDGKTEAVGEIERVKMGEIEPTFCEPHAIALKDGRILAHIRVHQYKNDPIFTVFQSESADGGKSWSRPRQILSRMGGSPPHLFCHSSGMLISTYGDRCAPCSAETEAIPGIPTTASTSMGLIPIWAIPPR